MNAKVRGIWLVVECPYCNKPQVIFKYVLDNTVDAITKIRHYNCDYCGENCFVQLKETEYAV